MNVFLFILSMTDASFGILADHKWDTVKACEEFMLTELIPVKGYAYMCGRSYSIPKGEVDENYQIG